jgi:type VI secretion system secreted protein VgrG
MAYTQEGRLIAVDTPLGADVLLLQGFTGHEGISRLFNFQLDLLSENTNVTADQLIGKPLTITLTLEDGSARYINGFVSRFAQAESDARFVHYHVEVVPWLWFLTRTADCRIFQDLTVPDIIEKVFRDLGFTDFKNNLQGSFERREYCVQYRETAFNFVSRLMEQYGIFYFFEHQATKHTLVLANTRTAHQPCPAQPRASCELTGGLEEEDRITSWHMEHKLRPGRYALADFNFEIPSTNIGASIDSTISIGGNSSFEIYDFPGEYRQKATGESLATIRMEEEEAGHFAVTGAGTCRGFISGYRFDLDGHYRRDANTTYLLTEIRHSATVGSAYVSGQNTGSEERYSNSFTCIPHRVPYRPRRLTPKPLIQGAQTAIVVGPSGEEIYTDKYGRVKVQFHWDREGQYNEKSSCWIRVAHSWAGKRWGTIFTPRLGQEVIVEFLEGDPDQPIITGRVYNAAQMPPYTLPDEKTKSTMKSYSSKGGSGFNEIRFEDKKDSEQVFIYAQKNQDNRVKNDSLEWVGNNRHLIVKKDQYEGADGDKHLTVKGDQNEKVDGTVSLKAGMDLQQKVGMKHALDAGMEIHLKAGMNIVIEAGVGITLKAGSSSINLTPAGIQIIGQPLVMINSGGSPLSGSGCSPEAPQAPKEADTAEPGQMEPPPSPKTRVTIPFSPQALALKHAAAAGVPFCDT